ncbi:hypothetical protein ERICI_04275 [Paenibacillus larvae subsp. larvae]|uniref:Uncharacterized protein n=2 Tax=Paenibacillus larvae subsp. larvae TaxID=147375 RepID=V9W3E6_9BACL|nr:hypothetical protein ERIC2_c02851 [Paenibacillus larvae subsp. larvae DSM 25430]AVF23975.1 hypothetical protein ERICI_04275 [Paenibacillus larvae subsp. larvae]ETK29353.1 hypothetical protein ERIC1_1c28960 [Paenibacillus larvae subsp. larvae DSM 25719]AVF24576.1 hypothetical protein ERICIII_00331 [Paenibacillus larvae subsp. larvae]AVF29337.1 hypothetical protein ERICIV_00331 [Paenibacillus larvae subsp. larvae]
MKPPLLRHFLKNRHRPAVFVNSVLYLRGYYGQFLIAAMLL